MTPSAHGLYERGGLGLVFFGWCLGLSLGRLVEKEDVAEKSFLAEGLEFGACSGTWRIDHDPVRVPFGIRGRLVPNLREVA